MVQDIFHHRDCELCRCDPASLGVCRKDGTVTNTNRQVQMGRPAVSPPGEAREDWWIEVELAKRLGLGGHTRILRSFAEMG